MCVFCLSNSMISYVIVLFWTNAKLYISLNKSRSEITETKVHFLAQILYLVLVLFGGPYTNPFPNSAGLI